jgi:DNA-binding MarR family transcriptional regulator
MISLVRRDGADLSARQMAVFLSVYADKKNGVHTVRSLAVGLNVSKPAITRALDRLAEFRYIGRKIDPTDRRSVLAVKTPDGEKFFSEVNKAFAAVFK